MQINVSPRGHFFQYEDGSPFFYLADTVWVLFNKLLEDEARQLFDDRSRKGFTVIQSVVFRDLFEPNTENAYKIKPFATEGDMFAVRMNPDWIAYVVKLTKIAAEYGLVMGLLPTWGDKWNEHSNSAGPVIMDQDSGKAYCRFLSDALAECTNVIWILGGDSPIQKQEYADTIRAMAKGLRSGGSSERLITFHPANLGSSAIFHSENWLDFNAFQTSHHKPNTPNYLHIERLYGEQPAKPCLDLEPNYEYSPMFILRDWPAGQPFMPVFSAYDVRKSLYRSVLAGAAGFTYGCEPIRQLHRQGDQIHMWPQERLPTWIDSISAPGSSQLGMLPNLLKERSYFTRVPAQELFIPFRQAGAWPDRMATGLDFAGQQNSDPACHISVARCTKGTYIMAYLPIRQILKLDTSGISGKRLRVSVYDPEKCHLSHSYEMDNSGKFLFIPERDLDTFIVLDSM